jgi:hypothetical protein
MDRMELNSRLLDNFKLHLCPSLALVPWKYSWIVFPVVLHTLLPSALPVGQKRMTAHDMLKSTLMEKFYIMSRNLNTVSFFIKMTKVPFFDCKLANFEEVQSTLASSSNTTDHFRGDTLLL